MNLNMSVISGWGAIAIFFRFFPKGFMLQANFTWVQVEENILG